MRVPCTDSCLRNMQLLMVSSTQNYFDKGTKSYDRQLPVKEVSEITRAVNYLKFPQI